MAELEIWKDIPGFEGKYQASNLGRVKSLKRVTRFGKIVGERILSGAPRNGYLIVNLFNDTGHKTYSVHRLIIKAFTGEWPPCIDHLNFIKTDNRLCNLEAVTQRENVHRYRATKRNLPVGVVKTKGSRSKPYQAFITINKKQMGLGYFKTPEEAKAAFDAKLMSHAV